MQGPTFESIDVAALAALLRGHVPFALFDARDEGLFAQSHLLFACALPLSDLEVRLFRLVPAHDTLLVLTSAAGDGMAERAALRCRSLGYRNIRLLAGGNEAWARAGHTLFRGIHVPSKAFGELIEAHYETPMIEPVELRALLDEGAPVRIFDCRPPHEFHRMSLPGARNCPGADLLARVPGQVRDDELVVINCAGRTRGIIGAQSLISAGIHNRVVALKNGTMGWHLAGFGLEHGRVDLVEAVDDARLGEVRASAAQLRERFDVPLVGIEALERLMRADRGALLLDVRGPWEYEAGHLPGARSAPGGQLVQATDYYVAVRNVPLVLTDDDGIRASITATWLVQMGFADVRVLDHADVAGRLTQTGPTLSVPAHLVPTVEVIEPAALARELDAGTTLLLDLGRSEAHFKGHIPGARFAIRSRLGASLPKLPRLASVTLVADDDVTAAFAAVDVARVHGVPVRVLPGGTAAWHAVGLPLKGGLDDAVDPPEDMWHIPSSPLGGLDSAMRDYLTWEVGLAAQVAREPGARFAPGGRRPAEADAPAAGWLDVDPAFRRRWSRRAMSGESLRPEEIRALFEAARWAPSASNSQPWRFVYATRDSRWWDEFFDLLNPGNKRWAGRGGLLGFILSTRIDAGGKSLRSHAFDAGAAWQSMALQAHHLGLVMHGMGGFEHERARQVLELDPHVEIQAMFVAGRPGGADWLPKDLQLREIPSGRLPLEDLAFEGRLGHAATGDRKVVANALKEAS